MRKLLYLLQQDHGPCLDRTSDTETSVDFGVKVFLLCCPGAPLQQRCLFPGRRFRSSHLLPGEYGVAMGFVECLQQEDGSRFKPRERDVKGSGRTGLDDLVSFLYGRCLG
jgi:hypothetical protein